jgi:hypothetical protein
MGKTPACFAIAAVSPQTTGHATTVFCPERKGDLFRENYIHHKSKTRHAARVHAFFTKLSLFAHISAAFAVFGECPMIIIAKKRKTRCKRLSIHRYAGLDGKEQTRLFSHNLYTMMRRV